MAFDTIVRFHVRVGRDHAIMAAMTEAAEPVRAETASSRFWTIT